MKKTLTLCAVAFLFSLPLMAENQEVEFPKDEPLIDLTIPDGWKFAFQGDSLQAVAGEDLSTMMQVKTLHATKKEGSQAIAEIKEVLDKSYGNVEYDKIEEGGTENLGLYVLNAKAKVHAQNGDTTTFINSIIVSLPDSNELLLVQFLSTQEGADKNGEAMTSVIESLKKHE